VTIDVGLVPLLAVRILVVVGRAFFNRVDLQVPAETRIILSKLTWQVGIGADCWNSPNLAWLVRDSTADVTVVAWSCADRYSV